MNFRKKKGPSLTTVKGVYLLEDLIEEMKKFKNKIFIIKIGRVLEGLYSNH